MEEASHLSSLDKAPLVPCRCSSYKASTDERWTKVQESNFRSQKSLSGVIFVRRPLTKYRYFGLRRPSLWCERPVIDFVHVCRIFLNFSHASRTWSSFFIHSVGFTLGYSFFFIAWSPRALWPSCPMKMCLCEKDCFHSVFWPRDRISPSIFSIFECLIISICTIFECYCANCFHSLCHNNVFALSESKMLSTTF